MSAAHTYPVINPALRRLWRDATTVQLGLDPDRAVVLANVDRVRAHLLQRLDGRTDRAMLRAVAEGLGLPAQAADELLDLLDAAGVLEHRPPPARRAAPAEDARLVPDLAAATLARPGLSAGDVRARRQRAAIRVVGAGRVGAALAHLLAAAGIGAVLVEDERPVGVTDQTPAGLHRDQVGAERATAARRALRAQWPGVRTRLRSPKERPVLAVLADQTAATSPGIADDLLRTGIAHLVADVWETTGVVGPLVLPGRSCCLRCLDLHRADRDRDWPTLAAQLATPRHDEPCDVALATAVAAHATLQALSFVDTGEPPDAVDATWEIPQAGGATRRRRWGLHPGCGCHWQCADGPFVAVMTG